MIINYFIILFLFLLFDGCYFMIIYKNFNKMIKEITNSNIKLNYITAIITYLLLAFSLYYFIILPKKSYLDAFLLGLVIFGIYDFSNLTIFEKYNLNLGLIDTIYGATIFTLITFIINLIKIEK